MLTTQRCTAHRKDGQQCSKARLAGVEVCRSHGGAAPQVKKKAAIARLARVVGTAKLVTAISAEDWEADPLHSFEMEFRRTLAGIRYYEELIAKLREEDLFWGKVSEVHKKATEFPGVDVTYEARLNEAESSRRWERNHLMDLHRIWINAKLDQRKLEIEAHYVERLQEAITNVITRMGRDSRDPEIRNIVRQELAALGPG